MFDFLYFKELYIYSAFLLAFFSTWIFLTENFSNFLFIKKKEYKAVQRIHDYEVSRMGGFIIFLSFYIFILIKHFFFEHDHFFCILSLCSIPIFVISFYEDLYQSASAEIRLLFMFASVILSIFMSNIDLPIIDFPVIGEIISSSFLIYFFYIISVVIFINGVNMVDGTNGLMAFTVLAQLLSLSFISFTMGDFELLYYLSFLIIPLIIFLFFNFPLGKIFMGDLGCYLYGFFVALITIKFYGMYDLPSWGAVLILFFPLMEVFFSYFRKIKSGKSPYHPDIKHIHSLYFRLFFVNSGSKKISNNFVAPSLAVLWLLPFLLYVFFYNNIYFLMISIVFLISLYLCLYKNLSKMINNI